MATYGLKSLTVGNDTYEINTKSGININGTSWDGSSSRTIYAPISAGTNGYFLKSNGSGAPTWASISTSSTPVANTIAKFDSSAHMNSADMTAQEISAFVNTVPSGFANLNNLSVINNIIAGGDITDGAGNVLSAVAVNDIISLKPSGDITRSGTGDSRVTSYTTITSNGSKLTNNGGVKIGSGVSLIKVCYGLAINTTGTNHTLNAQLYKNSTRQSVYGFDTKQAQSGRGAISFPPTLMSVSSGDVIDIGWYGQTGDTLYANGTTLTVEVVK